MAICFEPITWENYPADQWKPIGMIAPPAPKKCKCCGAPLIHQDDKIFCEYCGTAYKWGD